MFRSKLLVRNFTTCNQIQSKTKITPLVCGSDSASLSSLAFKRFLLDNRNDSNGFRKLNPAPNVPIIRSDEKSFSKFSDAKCWNCNKYLEVENFTCVNCGALQYPKRRSTYFELFGISQGFDIDLEELSQKFKNLQKIFHPDKFAGKTKAEKDLSETYSRLVNKAYSTLKDPSQRGFYLLTLLKYPECDSPLEQEFLKIMMSKNEVLETLNTAQAINKYRNDLKDEINEYLELIKQDFKSGNVNEAKVKLTKLSYLNSLDKRAKEKIEKGEEKKTC